MDSKKKKGTKVTVDSRQDSVQPRGGDMSKYSRAISDKSRINYAELKLARSESALNAESAKEEKRGKKTKASQSANGKDGKKKKNNTPRDRKSKFKDKKAQKSGSGLSLLSSQKQESKEKAKAAELVSTSGKTADERYSSALTSEDHYSSAVEKYYLKYPNVKRPNNKTSLKRSNEPKKKRKRRSSGAEKKEKKLSMAEIAVKNKRNAIVRERAKAAKDARAKGTVSPRIANRSLHRRKKHSSGSLRVLAFFALAAVIVCVCVAVLFDIKQIKVVGDNPYGEAQIKKLCTFSTGDNILFIDTRSLEEKVVRELPYIAECSIERRIPSQVVIKVTEAEVLGVAMVTENKWSVISTDGKILETVSNVKDSTDSVKYVPKYGCIDDFASERGIPVINGLDAKNGIEDGFIVSEEQKAHLIHFKTVKDEFARVNMELSSISTGQRGYEGEFNKRIAIIFGNETDKKTIAHYMDEVYHLIFDKGDIDREAQGEIRFSKSSVYYRRIYEKSEEELELINEQRRDANRKGLVSFATIFMETGSDWLEGKLTEE